VKRSGDDGDDSLIVFPLTNSSTVFSSGVAYDGQCNWIYAVCDVTIWCQFDVWRSLLTQRAYYSTRTLLTRYCSLQCVTVIHKSGAKHSTQR